MRSKLFAELGIPESYGSDPPLRAYVAPAELVDVEPNIVGVAQQLAPAAAEQWRAMQRRALAEGVRLLLVSGFRSVERQAALIRRKLEQGQALSEILATNAAPGYSQHHSGCAVDVATIGCPPLVEVFEHTDAFRWLGRHAGEFGFSMPYGRGNDCGFAYEPWHWFYGGGE